MVRESHGRRTTYCQTPIRTRRARVLVSHSFFSFFLASAMGKRSKLPKSPSRRSLSPKTTNGVIDTELPSQMLLSSNASSQGSSLERTTLPISRKHGNSTRQSADFYPLEKDVATERPVAQQSKGLSPRDRNAMALLIVLCQSCHEPLEPMSHVIRLPTDFIQGIPIGLAFGSIPFLLKSRLSYSQIGIFSLRYANHSITGCPGFLTTSRFSALILIP